MASEKKAAVKKKTVQRIRLRLSGNPVKLDATITDMDPNGKWVMVSFDAPLPDAKLYEFGERLLIDQPTTDGPGVRYFEVV